MSDNVGVKDHTVEYVAIDLRVIKRETIPSVDGVMGLLDSWGLYNRAQESVWVVTYDSARGLRRVGEVARGSYHDVDVPIAATLLMVITSGAERFWLVHNHPSGHVVPTLPDIDLTHKVMTAANTCGLRMEDHIIIGPPDKSFSFYENHMILLPDETKGRATSTAAEAILQPVTHHHAEEEE